MKKFLSFASLLVLFSLVSGAWAEESPSTSNTLYRGAIMRPDPATREKWYNEWLIKGSDPAFPNATGIAATIDENIGRTLSQQPAPLLLDHITYTPSERDQVSCGNCWVWAGTALMEIAHSVQNGVKDRLSTQWFDSCFYQVPTTGYYACGGGNLTTFSTYYNSTSNPRPWSNSNAYFQDQPGGSAPHVSCSSIANTPQYYIRSMTPTTIPTAGQTQATAIANIKNILLQNKGVQFNFWQANNADWNNFYTMWDGNESVVWDPDTTCGGHTWIDGQGGGHAVTIVGWNDDDAANPYWIVLNSWGTSNGARPNGLFRMKMNMNYDCYYYDPVDVANYYSRQFQTANIEFSDSSYAAGTHTNSLYMAVKGVATPTIWVRKKTDAGWSAWANYGGSTPNRPAMATFNTKLYMVVRGSSSNALYIRSMDSNGAWSSWATTPGTTSAAPALVVFQNRLYLFVKGTSSSVIWYKSMDTHGTWSAWAQISGSSTVDTPGLGVFNSRLYMYQTGFDGYVYFKSMGTDGTWSGGWLHFTNLQTHDGPTVTAYNNNLFVAVRGEPTVPYSNKTSYVYSSAPDSSYIPWQSLTGTGSYTPVVAVGPTPNMLNFGIESGGNSIWFESWNGSAWSSWTQLNGTSTDAPAMSTYWFGGP